MMTGWIRRRRQALALVAAMFLLPVVADRLFPPDLSRYQDRSVTVTARDGELLHTFTTSDGKWRLATTPEQVDPTYIRMLLAAEDNRFREHRGIDPLALGRAAWQLVSSQRIVSGGSTLTMQVARLLEPHGRSLFGKVKDLLRAAQLEERYGKEEILAMYLTLAPFGGNIEGVRAASLAWFGHEPNQLTPGEAAILVALPQRPAHLRPDRHPEAALAAADKLLARLVADGRLAPDVAETPAPQIAPRRTFPARAVHVAERLRHRPTADGMLKTTLDGGLQQSLEDLAAREIGWTGDGGDMAAIVVDNRDATIRAWIGGVHSALDLARTRRSPGSALKPFIYGLAFEDLAILPDTLIEDRPMRFGNWAPEDFDRGFRGQVTAREALQQSLNLPAVELLDRVGAGRLTAALEGAGAHLVFPSGGGEPSLPLALGGVGISLQDLTGLYVALARGGRPVPLRILAGQAAPARPLLFSQHAASLVTEILRGAPPPDGRLPPLLAAEGRPIAYKTGTSYGFRDAWAVGYTEDWTVGIWTGRRDGTPRPGLYGRNTAAPLLFDVFDLLPQEGSHDRVAAADAPAPHLPQGLQQFATRGTIRGLPGAQPPRILYPPEGAVIDLTGADGSRGTLALEADGGALPYRWSVNGVPLPPTQFHAVPHWTPDGPGFARVTVLDGAGRKASVTVRVE
ncbi:MAG TPA: penicillin-binding protein 1C [Stellaceae bacterium]|nr:penicillin-binding protein 1C [Stellaceae bacterium]